LTLGFVANEALPLLERSLARSDPGDSIVRKLYYMIVQCHRQLGQPAEALAACRRGRSYYAQDAELLSQEAQLRAEQGDGAGAEACYLQLLAGPEAAHLASVPIGLNGYITRHNLAVLYHQQGRLAEAETQWRAAVEEKPDFVQAWLGLEELYVSQGRWMELEWVAQQLANQRAGGLDAAVTRARGHLARKEFALAKGLLRHAIGMAPRALRPRVLLSHVFLQEDEDLDLAEKALADVLVIDPNHPEAGRNLAVLQARKRGHRNAVLSSERTS
jgi:tetratricopeptide (TPR) repeat protein